jgi:hypothetical protein
MLFDVSRSNGFGAGMTLAGDKRVRSDKSVPEPEAEARRGRDEQGTLAESMVRVPARGLTNVAFPLRVAGRVAARFCRVTRGYCAAVRLRTPPLPRSLPDH